MAFAMGLLLQAASPTSIDLSQGVAKATSVLNNDPKFVAANAFTRAFFRSRRQRDRSFPWISDGIPATVYIKLPNAVEVSSFSFRSRPEPIPEYSANFILRFPPTKFELVGSDDCSSWTTIFRVESTKWCSADQEKVWEVPAEQRRSFSCIGFKVLANGRADQAAIQDAKFWSDGEVVTEKNDIDCSRPVCSGMWDECTSDNEQPCCEGQRCHRRPGYRWGTCQPSSFPPGCFPAGYSGCGPNSCCPNAECSMGACRQRRNRNSDASSRNRNRDESSSARRQEQLREHNCVCNP